jgi:hypothetical protein
VPEHTAEIDRNLLNGEWIIRVRYVSGSVGDRRRWSRFVLVPRHQGQMFSEVCADVEKAIELHQRGAGSTIRPGYSSPAHV